MRRYFDPDEEPAGTSVSARVKAMLSEPTEGPTWGDLAGVRIYRTPRPRPRKAVNREELIKILFAKYPVLEIDDEDEDDEA